MGVSSFGLYRQRHLDLVADEEAACLERRVPAETEILAVQRQLSLEHELGVAPRILRCAKEARGQYHATGDAPDGEIAAYVIDVAATRCDRRARERQRRVSADVEEIGAAKVLVAISLGGVDGVGLDRDVDARIL